MRVRLPPEHADHLLEELLYEQVAELLPFAAIRELVSTIGLLLLESGYAHTESKHLAHAYIDRALARLATDPRRHEDLERVLVVRECPI